MEEWEKTTHCPPNCFSLIEHVIIPGNKIDTILFIIIFHPKSSTVIYLIGPVNRYEQNSYNEFMCD